MSTELSWDGEGEADEDFNAWTEQFLGATIAESEVKEHENDDSICAKNEDEDGEDSVDWEDGDEEELDWKSADNGKDFPGVSGPSPPPRAVTVHLEANDNTMEGTSGKEAIVTRKKPTRRRKIRLESLSRLQQAFVWNLHRAHLLSMCSRVVYLSSVANDEDLRATCLSLLPSEDGNCGILSLTSNAPSYDQVNRLVQSCTRTIKEAPLRRRRRLAANRAAGAPRRRPTLRRTHPVPSVSIAQELLDFAVKNLGDEEDPQLQQDRSSSIPTWFSQAVVVALLRARGWRARWVHTFQCIPVDLTEDHPAMTMLSNEKAPKSVNEARTHKISKTNSPTAQNQADVFPVLDWVEVYCRSKHKNRAAWVHVDIAKQLVDNPQAVEAQWRQLLKMRKAHLSYAVAVEHQSTKWRLTDVTPRYSSSMVASMRLRGLLRGKRRIVDTWWVDTLQRINRELSAGCNKENAIDLRDDDTHALDRKPAAKRECDTEAEELRDMAEDEAIPSSKTGFQSHPKFVIPSVLGNAEVIHPEASLCGLVKGERVYLRKDVSTALPARKWPYKRRHVKTGEKPIKIVKARKKPTSKRFKALATYSASDAGRGDSVNQPQYAGLEDGQEALFAFWQTEPWSPPPVGPGDKIPVNSHNNLELELLNPGLEHIDVRGSAKVAKKLGVPYAPCLLGFEGHGGNRVPVIRGVVVHSHNFGMLKDAVAEARLQEDVTYEEKRLRITLRRWKKLFVGLLTEARLEKEYGEDNG